MYSLIIYICLICDQIEYIKSYSNNLYSSLFNSKNVSENKSGSDNFTEIIQFTVLISAK